MSRARYTSPIPPEPSAPTTSKEPSFVPGLSIRSLSPWRPLGISPGGSDAIPPARLHSFRVLSGHQHHFPFILLATPNRSNDTSGVSPSRQAKAHSVVKQAFPV